MPIDPIATDVENEVPVSRSPYGASAAWIEQVRTGLPPLIITCCLNGGVQGKESHPGLPETPAELARSAKEAYDAGASAVHVHPRNPEDWSESSGDPDFNYEVNALIREACPDLIINNTTGGSASTTMEQRFAMVDANCEMASLNLGPDMSRFRVPERSAPLEHPHPAAEYDLCIPFTYGTIEGLAAQMHRRGIRPEMELYNPGQFWVSNELIRKALIEPPYVFQFVMGYQTASFATPEALVALARDLPDGAVYFVAGVGVHQLPMTTMATIMGGHVRVGLEDNLYYSRGVKLTGNGQAVERAVRIAREVNREVASPAQARETLGLSSVPSTYEARGSAVAP
ncbi:3-keto-5-aminohexanoate cleavage protein [Cryptosporangium sp. NPDC051539]|uniref:3-keto-5-aminohexanoate cleavage protein n=1 Tax=Cryptosporangium sp. NPDC051539 TaxID=3363962 RepID=UPI0037AF1674